MPFYEVLGGKHVEGSGHHARVYVKGDMVESAVDLTKVFRNKFREVVPSQLKKSSGKEVVRSAKKRTKIRKKGAPAEPAAAEARGVDVSDDFPEAAEAGLQVFKRGQVLHVFEKDETSPLNDKGLKKTEVLDFIKDFLEK